jgi:hypothetical protein
MHHQVHHDHALASCCLRAQMLNRTNKKNKITNASTHAKLAAKNVSAAGWCSSLAAGSGRL